MCVMMCLWMLETTPGNQYSPPAVWVPGIWLKFSGLAPSTFIKWEISPELIYIHIWGSEVRENTGACVLYLCVRGQRPIWGIGSHLCLSAFCCYAVHSRLGDLWASGWFRHPCLPFLGVLGLQMYGPIYLFMWVWGLTWIFRLAWEVLLHSEPTPQPSSLGLEKRGPSLTWSLPVWLE